MKRKTIMPFKFCFSKCCKKKTFFSSKYHVITILSVSRVIVKNMWKQGRLTWRGRMLSTVDLFINVAYLNNVYSIESTSFKIISARRSTVLSHPFSETSLVNYSSIYTFSQGIQSEGECPVQLTSSLRKLV